MILDNYIAFQRGRREILVHPDLLMLIVVAVVPHLRLLLLFFLVVVMELKILTQIFVTLTDILSWLLWIAIMIRLLRLSY